MSEPDDDRRAPWSTATPAALDLAELRSRIDLLDQELVRLLNERAQLGIAAGRIKRGMGRGVPDPGREAEVLTRVEMANAGPFPNQALASIYREIMKTIVELEELDEAVAARRNGRAQEDE